MFVLLLQAQPVQVLQEELSVAQLDFIILHFWKMFLFLLCGHEERIYDFPPTLHSSFLTFFVMASKQIEYKESKKRGV